MGSMRFKTKSGNAVAIVFWATIRRTSGSGQDHNHVLSRPISMPRQSTKICLPRPNDFFFWKCMQAGVDQIRNPQFKSSGNFFLYIWIKILLKLRGDQNRVRKARTCAQGESDQRSGNTYKLTFPNSQVLSDSCSYFRGYNLSESNF